MADNLQTNLFGEVVGGLQSRPRPQQLGLYLTLPGVEVCTPSLRLHFWRIEDGKTMGRSTEIFQEETAVLGRRWADALRRRYDATHTAKRVARDFKCEVRTAEGWLAGNAPQARFLLRAWRLHGAALVAEVLAPDSDVAKVARLDVSLGEVEAKLKALGDELTILRGEVT